MLELEKAKLANLESQLGVLEVEKKVAQEAFDEQVANGSPPGGPDLKA